MTEQTHLIVAKRARYTEAGKAMRAAQARMVATKDPAPSDADWRVFTCVCCFTVSYSKLTDRVRQADIVDWTGLSARQVRRSLRRIAEWGVIVFVPGRGAGNRTVVGIPPQGMKAADYLSALGLPQLAAKADRAAGQKSGQPSRARGSLEVVLGEEERHRTREEVVGGVRCAREAQADENGSDPTLFEADQLPSGKRYGWEP